MMKKAKYISPTISWVELESLPLLNIVSGESERINGHTPDDELNGGNALGRNYDEWADEDF